MDKFKALIYIVFLLIISVFATGGSSAGNADMELKINEQNKLKINMTEPVKQMNGQVFKSKEEMLKEYFQVQKKMDVEDIKVLWASTIDRNPVIKFALKKLATPADQRRVHSSIMSKTVSTLISGASILPGILGADPVTSTAASAGGTLANRIITSKEMPKEFPLTDTELIHLARLVEDLQDKVIKNYYEYKSDLESLKIARKEVISQNKSYSDAIGTNEPLSIMTTKILYDNALKNEMHIKQRVKLNRLELVRLVGDETLGMLKLGKVLDINNPNQPADSESSISSKVPLPAPPKKYGDESVKELAEEVGSELKEEQSNMLSDLRILWGSAVERSETIRFAILKLSNPDGKVEKTSSVKKILSPLTSAATLVGMGTGNPLAVTSTMFGGEFLNSLLSSENSELNSHLSKVTDTDLVLLAQETDDLQQKLVNLYCNYIDALAELNFVNKTLKTRIKYSETAKHNSQEFKTIADVFYKQGMDDQYKAQQKVLSVRVELEQFVGNEALIAIDKNVKQRLSMQGSF